VQDPGSQDRETEAALDDLISYFQGTGDSQAAQKAMRVVNAAVRELERENAAARRQLLKDRRRE